MSRSTKAVHLTVDWVNDVHCRVLIWVQTTSLLTPCFARLAAKDYSRLYSTCLPKSPARKLEFASSTKVVNSRAEKDKPRPYSSSDVAVASSASNNTENHSFGTTIMKAVGMIFSGLSLASLLSWTLPIHWLLRSRLDVPSDLSWPRREWLE